MSINQNEIITTKQILEEILKNRKELKNSIDALESRLLLKIEELNHKIINLENENESLRKEVEVINRNLKKNGIVIYGLSSNDKITVEFICSKLENLLEINLTPEQISDCYLLGQNANNPIKVELVNFWKKREILKNASKLKGKNIYISPDLTKQQLAEGKILRANLKAAKEENLKDCYIKGNKLYTEGKVYTVDELVKIEIDKRNYKRRNNSAPHTPTLDEEQPAALWNEGEEKQTHPEAVNLDTPTSSKNSSKTLPKPQGPITRLQENKVRKNSTNRK